MYWREKNDCSELMARAVDSFEQVLLASKLEHRVRLVNLLMDIVVENGIDHPRIIESFENLVGLRCNMVMMNDISNLVQTGRKCNKFSERFFDQLFQYALKLLPVSGSADVVTLLKTFSDRQAYVEQFTSKSTLIKEHIAQDIEKTSVSDICHMIELFKNDHAFNKFLLISLIDKM